MRIGMFRVTRFKNFRIDALISWQNGTFKRLFCQRSPGPLAAAASYRVASASAARTLSSLAGSPFSLLNGPYGAP